MHNVHWSTDVVTPPAIEPVTLAEAKDHLRIDVTDDDALVGFMIQAARESIESFLGRTIITTTFDLFLDRFPGRSGTIVVPSPRLQSVTTVKFIDTAGVLQTVPSADFLVDTSSEPGRITPSTDSLIWEETETRIKAVEVRYVAGYGTATTDVPEAIRLAILLMTADLYEHRENQSEVRLIENRTVQSLLYTHKAAKIS